MKANVKRLNEERLLHVIAIGCQRRNPEGKGLKVEGLVVNIALHLS